LTGLGRGDCSRSRSASLSRRSRRRERMRPSMSSMARSMKKTRASAAHDRQCSTCSHGHGRPHNEGFDGRDAIPPAPQFAGRTLTYRCRSRRESSISSRMSFDDFGGRASCADFQNCHQRFALIALARAVHLGHRNQSSVESRTVTSLQY
jgi:hypothetical protein